MIWSSRGNDFWL